MRYIVLALGAMLFTACSFQTADDPLKNTKKLVVKGHSSLYHNGMLEIPFTKLHFIPSVATTWESSKELIAEDAKEALQKSLIEALASVYIIPQGSQQAYAVSQDLFEVSNDLSETIRNYTRDGGIWLIRRSSKLAEDHIIDAFKGSKRLAKKIYRSGDKIETFFDKASSDILELHWKGSQKIFEASTQEAKAISQKSAALALKHLNMGKEAFIQGYIALPQTLGDNIDKMDDSFDYFAQGAQDANELRKDGTLYFSHIISDTISHYGQESLKSFSQATSDFSHKIEQEGPVLASLKSMGLLLKGIFYDGLIKPVSELTVGTLGLISVNGAIYPVNLVLQEAKATTLVMVEITAQSALSLYDVVAPSMSFALASIVSSGEYLAGKVAAGATVTAGATASGVTATAGATLSGLTKLSGKIAGKATQYVGVPIAVSSKAIGEVSYGLIASSSALALGTGALAAGESVALATQITGTALSGATLVGGTGYSVARSSAQGLYQLGKAVVLPAGYTLSSGIVLGYGALTQLQAHTILAASDAAYMVLSLEGPKWVLYTLSGEGLETQKALVAGTVVDLKALQKDNQSIKRIEVSESEMSKILESMDKALPLLP